MKDPIDELIGVEERPFKRAPSARYLPPEDLAEVVSAIEATHKMSVYLTSDDVQFDDIIILDDPYVSWPLAPPSIAHSRILGRHDWLAFGQAYREYSALVNWPFGDIRHKTGSLYEQIRRAIATRALDTTVEQVPATAVEPETEARAVVDLDRAVRFGSAVAFFICALSIPAWLAFGIILVNPLLSIMGIIGSVTFFAMTYLRKSTER